MPLRVYKHNKKTEYWWKKSKKCKRTGQTITTRVYGKNFQQKSVETHNFFLPLTFLVNDPPQKFEPKPNRKRVQAFQFKKINFYGVPRTIRTDNDNNFKLSKVEFS